MSEKRVLVVAHGDLDGVISAALIMRRHGLSVVKTKIVFTQPFLVDTVKTAEGEDWIEDWIFVVDIAVNNRDPEKTRQFAERIGKTAKKVWWYDHHQGWQEFLEKFRDLPRNIGFIFRGEHPSCAALIAQMGTGEGQLVADATAADTRTGELSEVGRFIEEATKADLSDDSIRESAVRWIMNGGRDDSDYRRLHEAQTKYQRVQEATEKLVKQFEIRDGVAIVDVRDALGDYDRTQLLVKGEQMASTKTALVLGKSPEGQEVITVATMNQQRNLVTLFGLPSGAPFRVSLPGAAGWTVERVLKTLSQ